MRKTHSGCKYYPTAEEVDAWLEGILDEAAGMGYDAEIIDQNGFTPQFGIRHFGYFRYVRFLPAGMEPFYVYWQPALSGPAPLLVHTPGYSANVSAQPDLVMQGYTVMHVNPLGYMTPEGPDESKMAADGHWPVLPDTISSGGKKGYKEWLLNCALALDWAQRQPDVIPGRFSFFGTSQGGGCSLLLASLYKDRGVRCAAADVPFLTNFPLARQLDSSSYREIFAAMEEMEDEALGWRGLGFVDTISHVHRLNIPVLLTAAAYDTSCPAETIESLFTRLPGTKTYCFLANREHGHTREFIPLAAVWFRLYA